MTISTRTRRNLALSCLMCTIVSVTAACSSNSKPSVKPTPSATASASPTVSAADLALAEAAFEGLSKAGREYDNGPFDATLRAAQQKDLATAVAKAREARDVLYNYDAKLRALRIPASTQLAMNAVLEANRDQIATLDKFATVDLDGLSLAWSQLFVDDSVGLTRADELRGALGHPVPDVVKTDDDYYRAFATWVLAQNSTAPQWRAAVAAGNLSTAQGISKEQSETSQTFADAVAAMNTPSSLDADVSRFASAMRDYIKSLDDEAAMMSTQEMRGSKASETAIRAVSEAAATLRTGLDRLAEEALKPSGSSSS